ncbi:hypothetical protein Vadar_032424 [Vaccinium darrowii]|uniref:Uncharacterized protein n=1 Tax=Vaccinium darrowii TaxID=229202 RepID=A0ACB7YRP5_9ERIC|nr:hypothetical protein Vadar_032424 [Vaccinium darrowii]
MCNNKRTLRLCSGNTCGITDEVYFPRDIWVDILTRLPGKMVGQCKCICKHWQALIEEPSFVELHHFRAKSRPGGCYLVIFSDSSCANDFKDTSFFSANYEGGLAQNLFSYPASGLCTAQACVNGLICLCDPFSDSIVIVNPITKEIVALPPHNKPWSGYTNMGHCRKIDIVPSASRFEFGIDGVCLGGVIHWRNFAYEPLPVDDEVVVTFDLKDERFRVVSLPRGPTSMPRLVEVGGYLAACLDSPLYETVEEELWILDDYDNWVWVKERIVLPPGFVGPEFVHTNGSNQTERLPVSLVNDVDYEKGPAHFTYFPTLTYPKPVDSAQPSSFSCTCHDGCHSGDLNCPCTRKNGGVLPYTSLGVLLSFKTLIYVCCPSCLCPSNCRNWMSQAGLKVRFVVLPVYTLIYLTGPESL